MNNNIIKLKILWAAFSFFIIASCKNLSNKSTEMNNPDNKEMNNQDKLNTEVSNKYKVLKNSKNPEFMESQSKSDETYHDKGIKNSKKSKLKIADKQNKSNIQHNFGSVDNQLELIRALCASVENINGNKLILENKNQKDFWDYSDKDNKDFITLGKISFLLFTNPGNKFNKVFQKTYDDLLKKNNLNSKFNRNNRRKNKRFENSDYTTNTIFNNSNYIEHDNPYSNYERDYLFNTNIVNPYYQYLNSGPPNVIFNDDTSGNTIKTNKKNDNFFDTNKPNNVNQNFSNRNPNNYNESEQLPDWANLDSNKNPNNNNESEQLPDWANLDLYMDNDDIFNDDDLDMLMKEYIDLMNENIKHFKNKNHLGNQRRKISISDCFNILGLNSSASVKEIKKRYKELARKNHPDKNPSGDSSQFLMISEAYLTLKNVKKFN